MFKVTSLNINVPLLLLVHVLVVANIYHLVIVHPYDIRFVFVSGEYVAAFRQAPKDPLISLCIGLTFFHLASQKFSTKRHSLVVQVRTKYHTDC